MGLRRHRSRDSPFEFASPLSPRFTTISGFLLVVLITTSSAHTFNTTTVNISSSEANVHDIAFDDDASQSNYSVRLTDYSEPSLPPDDYPQPPESPPVEESPPPPPAPSLAPVSPIYGPGPNVISPPPPPAPSLAPVSPINGPGPIVISPPPPPPPPPSLAPSPAPVSPVYPPTTADESPPIIPADAPSPTPLLSITHSPASPKKSKTWVWAVVAPLMLLAMVAVTVWWFRHSLREMVKGANGSAEEGTSGQRKKGGDDGIDNVNLPIDEEFEKLAGPRKFSYQELAVATDRFSDEQLLGEGGSAKVYRGYMKSTGEGVAIKKLTPNSKYGLKEYAAEVKALSQLRHRSLVQLIGWCHDERDLLVVYEFMSNGSLDSHLFTKDDKTALTWDLRFKMVQDLGSAILYLHEEWSRCVVHRDIKCSNIMLDSGFNAKLGDFGLARLNEHGEESHKTTPAGTIGYIAPECLYTGRPASKESDVYSFGIVLLEIACGRRVTESRTKEQPGAALLQRVWELYGTRKVLDAADPKLEGSFNRKEMECVMAVGLMCAHPEYTLRPSIRDVVSLLKWKSDMPMMPILLPSKMPVPTYAAGGPLIDASPSTLISSDNTGSSSGTSNMIESVMFTASSIESSHSSPSPLLQNAEAR